MTNEDLIGAKFCTTKEAAELLGVSITTVQKYCESGLINMYKSTGGHRRVSMTSLQDFILNGAYSGRMNLREENKIKVMLFENDPQVAEALEFYCHQSKFEINYKKSNSVFDMIIKIMLIKPELIVLSLDLAEFDGYRLAKSIANYPRLKNVQVILTSNKYHDLSDFAAELRRRFVFVQKPIIDGWLDGYFFGFRIQKYLSIPHEGRKLNDKKQLMEITKLSYDMVE
jgi:excisionase family DNA binding protein